MNDIIQLYITYEREIAIISQTVLIIITSSALLVGLGIRRKLRWIIKQINTYLNSIMQEEEEEIQRQQAKKKREVKEAQNQLISKVLEEIFP